MWESALKDRHVAKDRGLCLFAAPRSLWKNDNDVELVMGGTCALVFRVSFDKVDELLGKVSRHLETEKRWEHFLTKEVAPWKERQQPSKPCSTPMLYNNDGTSNVRRVGLLPASVEWQTKGIQELGCFVKILI